MAGANNRGSPEVRAQKALLKIWINFQKVKGSHCKKTFEFVFKMDWLATVGRMD